MTTTPSPWSDPEKLRDLAADLRREWLDRRLYRVSVGPDWLRLNWEGEDRTGLLMSLRPGAVLACAVAGPWPTPVRKALPLVKDHLLNEHLPGATLTALGVFPEDKIWAVRLRNDKGDIFTLLHQVFGARGNTTLLDADTRLLWARNHPPHPLLHREPPAETWASGQAGSADLQLHGSMEDHFLRRVAEDSRHRLQGRLSRAAASTERLVANLRTDLDRADRGDEFRRSAEALAANLHTIVQGQATAEIADLQDGTPLSLELDPALSPSANLEAWFRRARKAAKGRKIIAENLEKHEELKGDQQEALEKLADLQPGEDPVADLADLQEWEVVHQELIPEKKASTRPRAHSPEEPARPFRRYLLDGTWEVWVGRNNKENDELTHRASHTKDIWLHAQGVPGSHVILRTSGKPEQVPRRIIEKAAAIAALNCRSRHSALVPVIYTERRYVRKPRKAPPGLAVCLQEKSLFAEPGLPDGAEAI